MQIWSTIGADGLPSIILQYFLSLYSLNICILLATSALFWPIKTRFKDLTSEIQQFLQSPPAQPTPPSRHHRRLDAYRAETLNLNEIMQSLHFSLLLSRVYVRKKHCYQLFRRCRIILVLFKICVLYVYWYHNIVYINFDLNSIYP